MYSLFEERKKFKLVYIPKPFSRNIVTHLKFLLHVFMYMQNSLVTKLNVVNLLA